MNCEGPLGRTSLFDAKEINEKGLKITWDFKKELKRY